MVISLAMDHQAAPEVMSLAVANEILTAALSGMLG